MEERLWEENQRDGIVRRSHPNIAGFEDGRREPQSKNAGKLQKVENVRKQILP